MTNNKTICSKSTYTATIPWTISFPNHHSSPLIVQPPRAINSDSTTCTQYIAIVIHTVPSFGFSQILVVAESS